MPPDPPSRSKHSTPTSRPPALPPSPIPSNLPKSLFPPNLVKIHQPVLCVENLTPPPLGAVADGPGGDLLVLGSMNISLCLGGKRPVEVGMRLEKGGRFSVKKKRWGSGFFYTYLNMLCESRGGGLISCYLDVVTTPCPGLRSSCFPVPIS